MRLAWLLPLLFAAGPASAYECTRTAITSGPSLTWTARTVRWVLDSDLTADIADAAQARAALEASFTAWNDVSCSDLVFELSEVRPDAKAEAPDGGPYENVVTFLSRWPYEANIIALTTNAYDPRSGAMLDSDIEINDAKFTFVIAENGCQPEPGRMDLQNTITHEVGHVLGLDHPAHEPRFQDDTMFASAPPCEIAKRSLAEGDMAGICAIYPAGQPNAPCFPAEGPLFEVVGSDDGRGCAASRGAGWGTALAILGLIAARLRRRPT